MHMTENQPLAPIHYRIAPNDLHGHHFDVTVTIGEPAQIQMLSLPAWIPGSYLIREFVRHLSGLHAQQNGQACLAEQINKNTWTITCQPGVPLQVHYRVYAFDNSVRAAWLDVQRGFFNPTSLCLRVHGAEQLTHGLQLQPPAKQPNWRLATTLTPWRVDAQGFGQYTAADYDELADNPVEMGQFWSGSCEVYGIPHHFVVAGASPSFDGERLLRDTQRICEAAMDFWHPQAQGDARGSAPHSHYTFMLNAVDNGYGGLEHRHSTALICNRSDLPRLGQSEASDGYRTLLGLISHEYFHTWNVKRLRPAEFARYDYDQENYTELLWFFEGFTSYYDDLLLRRAGLLDDAQYLKVLAKTIHQVAQTPGRDVQSVAQSSFDAWVKYYRQDENTANATVSYYTKGALIALCLDLHLRQHTAVSLDDVMRSLWARSRGGPISGQDIAAVLQDLTQSTQAYEVLSAWVHGVGDLPLAQYLQSQGIALAYKQASWPQRLGVLVQENAAGITLRRVQTASVAEQAGFAVGDEWLAIEVSSTPQAQTGNAMQASPVAAPTSAWRIKKLDDLDALVPWANQAAVVRALVARDGSLRWLRLQWPDSAAAQGEPVLTVSTGAALGSWLHA